MLRNSFEANASLTSLTAADLFIEVAGSPISSGNFSRFGFVTFGARAGVRKMRVRRSFLIFIFFNGFRKATLGEKGS